VPLSTRLLIVAAVVVLPSRFGDSAIGDS
jgi:hypothetical protein